MPEPTPTSDEAMASVRIRGALGDRVLALEHVGSTSVAGLVAKPLLDVLLVVADPDEESAYVPDLVALGLALRIREPLWHRLLKGTDPALNLHVFAPDCAEPVRMLRFRDHLRSHTADRDLYERTKKGLAALIWGCTQDYAEAKSDVVAEILGRAEPLRAGRLPAGARRIATRDRGGPGSSATSPGQAGRTRTTALPRAWPARLSAIACGASASG